MHICEYVNDLIKNHQPLRELGKPQVHLHPVNLENVETIAKVKQVHPKKKGAHTVVLTFTTVNQFGMIMSDYACTKMAKPPKKGQVFKMNNVIIESNGNGVKWLRQAE